MSGVRRGDGALAWIANGVIASVAVLDPGRLSPGLAAIAAGAIAVTHSLSRTLLRVIAFEQHAAPDQATTPFGRASGGVTASVSSVDRPDIDAVLRRIAADVAEDSRVTGLMVTGSRAMKSADDTSDLDLVLAVTPELAATAQVAAEVDGVSVDVVVISATELASFAEARTPSPYWSGGGLARMLHEGRILFDRTGVLTRAKSASAGVSGPEPTALDVHNARFSALYDYDHVRRLLAASNPRRQLAGELRLMHCLSTVLHHYYIARRDPWHGMRSAIKTLTESDPGFLRELEDCLSASGSTERCAKYGQVLRHAIEPQGSRQIGSTDTLVRLHTGALEASIPDSVTFWSGLIGGRR